MKSHGLVIDYRYCTGCHSCEIACRNELGLAQDEWGVKLAQIGPLKMRDAWEWSYIPYPTHLCTLCEDRIARGAKPACAQSCLAACMEAVPVDEISERMKKLGGMAVCFLP